MTKFRVHLRISEYASVEVTAENEEAAKAEALRRAEHGLTRWETAAEIDVDDVEVV